MKNVQILKVAHALIAGARGEAGGAPSKDSVFGVALVQGNVMTFGGRRGGVLRFKTEKKVNLDAVLSKFQGKLSGNPFGKNVVGCYTEITDAAALEALIPNTAEVIGKGYYKAMAHGKLNTNSTKKVAKAAKVAEVAA
jgi:hypothetical protein